MSRLTGLARDSGFLYASWSVKERTRYEATAPEARRSLQTSADGSLIKTEYSTPGGRHVKVSVPKDCGQ